MKTSWNTGFEALWCWELLFSITKPTIWDTNEHSMMKLIFWSFFHGHAKNWQKTLLFATKLANYKTRNCFLSSNLFTVIGHIKYKYYYAIFCRSYGVFLVFSPIFPFFSVFIPIFPFFSVIFRFFPRKIFR